MAKFQQVSKLKSMVIGSLSSDTGSEYLFGYDSRDGLMWMERTGVQYSPADPVWAEAEEYIRQVGIPLAPLDTPLGEEPLGMADGPWENPRVEVATSASTDRPKKVTKSVVGGGGEFAPPRPGDHRIVGDLEPGSEGDVEYGDEDIASQASEFLRNLGEEA